MPSTKTQYPNQKHRGRPITPTLAQERSIECPLCGAPPGVGCVSLGGNLCVESHRERRNITRCE